MSQINLKYPTNLPAATLVADAYQAPGGSVDSVPTLTQVNGEAVSAALEIQSVLGGLVLPRMTTAQRLALTPINGMEVYDLTLDSFFAYEAGAWQAGSGAISSLTQGANIVLTPNPIVTAGTIALNPVLTGLTSAQIGDLLIQTNVISNNTVSGSINLSPTGVNESVTISNTGEPALLLMVGANNNNFIGFETGALTTDLLFTLPIADGSSGQALITNGSGVLSFSTIGVFSWNDVTTATQTLSVENGYITNRGAGVVYTLPATAALGDSIIIDGKLGLTTINQNANQQILVASASSTVGVGGSVTATNVGDCITLRAIVAGASTVWRAESLVGNWNIL